jgi:CTP-dependent riboflavin kinase
VPGAQSVNEDTTLPIAGVSVADADSATLTTTLSVVHGTLTVATGGGATIGGNGSGTVTIGGTAAQINSALAALSYHGNLNFTGADTLTVTTSDGALNDIDTVPITVNAVNDPPVNTMPGPLSVNEDTTGPIGGVSVADVDGTSLTTTLTVTSGTLTVATGGGAAIGGNGSGSVTIVGTAAQTNTALAGLSYRGNLNFNGADTLTVITSDGALSDADTVPIIVNAVNDQPVNTVPGAQSVAEDTTLAIAGVSVADADSTALTATLTVVNGTLNVTTGGGAAIGGNGSGTVTISGSAAQINSALAALSYHGNLNFNGADTLTITTSDGALNDIDTVPITVNAVNDPPVNTVPGPLTVNEDTTLPIGVSVTDVDSAALTTTLSVTNGTLTVAAGGGAAIGGNGSGAVTISGTAAQINNALATLSYRGNLNFNGADTLTVTTSDGSLSDTDTVPITVNAVSDQPVNTVPGAQSVAEDTTLAITGVSVADVDSTALTTTLTVAHGTLTVAIGGGAAIGGNGSGAVTISGSAVQINTALGTLSYHGNLNFNGADTLTVATSDGSLNDTDTVPITVNAANDPPVNTVPGSRIVDEDTTLAITGVSIADVDSTALTTTLTVAHGTLSAIGAGVAGSGTATLTISGSATQINTALGTLSYHGNLDFNGADTLTVTTSDGALSDTDTVPITVNAVSDPPVNTVPGAQSVAEDTTLAIAGVSVADRGQHRAHRHAQRRERNAQRRNRWRRGHRRQR